MSTHEILKAARARIEKPENWTRRGSFSDGQICAGVAIERSCLLDGRADWKATTAGIEALLTANEIRFNGGPHFALFDWNDAPERTHAEVLEAFSKAIEATKP